MGFAYVELSPNTFECRCYRSVISNLDLQPEVGASYFLSATLSNRKIQFLLNFNYKTLKTNRPTSV